MNRLTDRFSCADFTFPLLPHDNALQLIKLLGIDAVDLGFFAERSHVQPAHVKDDVSGAAKALSSRLDGLGLTLADVFLQTGSEPGSLPANHPDRAIREATRELFKLSVEFAHACACRHITGLPGVAFPGTSDTDARALAAEEAVWRAETARQAGIVYAVEAHVGSICPTPETTLEFLARAPGVSLTLDYGHFIYQGAANEAVHPLLSHATHFHARAGCPGRLQTSLEKNTIDFAEIVSTLKRSGYAGYLCLEYVWVDWEHCNEVDNVSETLRLRDHLRSLES